MSSSRPVWKHYMGRLGLVLLMSGFGFVVSLLAASETAPEQQPGMPVDVFSTGRIQLSRAERDWLEQRNWTLQYCYGPSWKPYDYREHGQHKGIFHDYLMLFAHKLGVAFKPLHTETWQQALDAARERRCDFISGAVNTPSRRDYLAFTTPYFEVVHVLVAPEHVPFVTDLATIASETIAVPRSAAIIEILRREYPRVRLVEYEGQEELKDLLDNKRAYAAIAGLEYAAEVVNDGVGRYRIIGKLDANYPISIAVRNDQPPLFNIMQKAVDSLTQAERDAIGRRWTTFTIEEAMDYSLLGRVLGVIAVIALFLLYRQRQLNLFNRELMKEKERAEAANRAKSLFLANMSHEIRTPLNAVINLAQFGLEADVSPQVRRYFQGIADSGRLLLGIINEVLDYSKLESGEMPLENHPFEIERVVEQALAVVRPLAESKKLELHRKIDHRLRGFWLGDALKIEQILVNLIGNAVKFTPSGSITVEVGEYMQVGEDTLVRFQVQDTGIGMPTDQIERLFLPFQQADSSTTREYGGTGLGLAIVKKLLDMMEGSIGVNSQEGEGTTFYFDIPLQRAPKARISKTKVRDERGGEATQTMKTTTTATRKPRLLVAEDNELNQVILGELLAGLGIEADMVDNGQQAVERLSNQSADYAAVLLDVQMPVMDGFEAARRIRELPGCSRLPIIAITAHAFDSDREKCLAAGMTDFLAKPFDQERFKAVLQHILGLNTPTLDFEAGLKWAQGNQDLYCKIVQRFIETYESRLEALEDSGHEDLPRLLHDLKGNAKVIGASGLGEKAARADAALKHGESLSPECLQDIRAELHAVLTQLHEMLQQHCQASAKGVSQNKT